MKKENSKALKRDDEMTVRYYFKAYAELQRIREEVKKGMEKEKKRIENLSDTEKKKRKKDLEDVGRLEKKLVELDKRKKDLRKQKEESNKRTEKLKKRLEELENKYWQ